MKSIGIGLAALGLSVGLAQTPAARPEFEVAAIKSSPPPTAGGPHFRAGVQVDGAQIHCSALSLKDYIRIAYRVKDYQVVGPDWLASDRFDIAAKLPEGAKRDQVPTMLQSLLEDRFQLKS